MTGFTANVGGVEYELQGTTQPSQVASFSSTIRKDTSNSHFFEALFAGCSSALSQFTLNYSTAKLGNNPKWQLTNAIKRNHVTFVITKAFAARTTPKAVKAAAAAGGSALGGAAGGGP